MFNQAKFSLSSSIRSREQNNLNFTNSSQSGLYVILDMALYNPCLSNNKPLKFPNHIYFPSGMSLVVPVKPYASNKMSLMFPNYTCFPNGLRPVIQFNPCTSNGIYSNSSQELPLTNIAPPIEPLLIWQINSTLSRDIRGAVVNSPREGNDTFPCKYVLQIGNFSIPTEVRLLRVVIFLFRKISLSVA